MADPASVKGRFEVAIECEAREEALLFVEMLNSLLSQSDLSGYIFSDLTIESLERFGGGLRLRGRAHGEPLDTSKHAVGNEVKAATYSGLTYRTEGGKHYFQCLLDI
jgi:SHS2 domain-containing protein